MPLLILDITCETWKIIILNLGFIVLTCNWPQTKALMIWGLKREQDTRGREASGRQQPVGGRWKQDLTTTTGTRGVDGNTHTHQSGRALSQLLALLTAYTGYISELLALSSHLTCSGGFSDYTAAKVSPPKETPTKKVVSRTKNEMCKNMQIPVIEYKTA